MLSAARVRIVGLSVLILITAILVIVSPARTPAGESRPGPQTRPATTRNSFREVRLRFLMLIPVEIDHTITINRTGRLLSVEKIRDQDDKVREGQLTSRQMQKLTQILEECERKPSQ